MSQSVTIKSNKYGINLVLDADMSFADLIKAVVEKFKASANFFKNAKLAISFEGRHLSDEEQQQIIAAIRKIPQLRFCALWRVVPSRKPL